MMRGLGGDADSNNDQKITAGELHGFISKNVQKDAVSPCVRIPVRSVI